MQVKSEAKPEEAKGKRRVAFLGWLAGEDAENRLKAIDALQKKLSGLTKGTAAHAQTQKLHIVSKVSGRWSWSP